MSTNTEDFPSYNVHKYFTKKLLIKGTREDISVQANPKTPQTMKILEQNVLKGVPAKVKSQLAICL